MDYSQKIRELLIKAGADLKGVSDDTLLLEEGIIDSLIVSQASMEMEDAFHCEFEIDEIAPDNFASITAITKLISEKVG